MCLLLGFFWNQEIEGQQFVQDPIDEVLSVDTVSQEPIVIEHPPFILDKESGVPFLVVEKEVEAKPVVPIRSENLRRNRSEEQTILFYIFCAIFLLYGFVRWQFEGLLYIVPRILGNVRMMENYFEEPLSNAWIPRILLTINTFLVFGLLAFFALRFFIVEQVDVATWELLLIGLGVVLIFLLVKMLVQQVLILILPEKRPIELYLFNRRYTHWLMGLCLLPILILLSFTGIIPKVWLLLLAGLTVLVLVFWQYFRGFQLGQHLLKLYPFHFFLYFCTLEIAPVLILWGLINRFN